MAESSWIHHVRATIARMKCQFQRKIVYDSQSQGAIRIDGKNVIITGANTGIGFEVARDLYSRGANVFMLCRNKAKADAAMSAIEACRSGGTLTFVPLDLSSLASVRECAANLQSRPELVIDLIVNNAATMPTEPSWTEDDFELSIGANHLGHVLLNDLLLSQMRRESPGQPHHSRPSSRIVVTSSLAYARVSMDVDDVHDKVFKNSDFQSQGQTSKYDAFHVYSRSKLANYMYAIKLADVLRPDSIGVYCLNPGIVNTQLLDSFETSCLLRSVGSMFRPLVKTPIHGSQTTLHCCLADGLVSGGFYENCHELKDAREAVPPDIRHCLTDESVDKFWNESRKAVGLA